MKDKTQKGQILGQRKDKELHVQLWSLAQSFWLTLFCDWQLKTVLREEPGKKTHSKKFQESNEALEMQLSCLISQAEGYYR